MAPRPAPVFRWRCRVICALRAKSCKITTAFAKVGFSGDYGGTYFLTQLLGSARARELYLTSPVLTAKDAHAIGMVTKVVPDAEIDAAAHELALSLAQGPSIALGYHQAQHQQCRASAAGRLLRRRGDPSHPLQRYRGSQGSREGFRREAQAGLQGRMTMAPYMRLRQICLVAPQLAPVISDIAEIMGLAVCYRDGNVAKYGLENALLPVDTIMLEVVAPFKAGTTAGRFIEKTGGRGGYMAIFCCNDPDERGRNANALGVRTANVIDHAPYHGVQLHPRDCRAAFIEFNHTEGSDDILGAYPPAGPDWQNFIRKDVTQALTAVEMQSPDPQGLAAHWGEDHRRRD